MGTGNVPRNVRGYRFFTVDELETLMTDAGFECTVRREAPFCAVIKCVVPQISDADANSEGAALGAAP